MPGCYEPLHIDFIKITVFSKFCCRHDEKRM